MGSPECYHPGAFIQQPQRPVKVLCGTASKSAACRRKSLHQLELRNPAGPPRRSGANSSVGPQRPSSAKRFTGTLACVRCPSYLLHGGKSGCLRAPLVESCRAFVMSPAAGHKISRTRKLPTMWSVALADPLMNNCDRLWVLPVTTTDSKPAKQQKLLAASPAGLASIALASRVTRGLSCTACAADAQTSMPFPDGCACHSSRSASLRPHRPGNRFAWGPLASRIATRRFLSTPFGAAVATAVSFTT
jgi:hypothetical protein